MSVIQFRSNTIALTDAPPSAAVELVEIATLVAKPREFSARRDATDPAHVADLAKRLEDGGSLDPLDVWRSGTKLFVVDGFHRLAAYKAVKWSGPVSVRVHAGPRLVDRRPDIMTVPRGVAGLGDGAAS